MLISAVFADGGLDDLLLFAEDIRLELSLPTFSTELFDSCLTMASVSADEGVLDSCPPIFPAPSPVSSSSFGSLAPVTDDSGLDPELSFVELGLERTSLCSPVVSFGDSGLDSSKFLAELASPAILSLDCVGLDFESSVTFSLAGVGLESSAKDCDSCLLGSKADDGLDPSMLFFPDVGLESSALLDFAETGLDSDFADPVLLSLAVVGLEPSVLDLADIGLKSS